MGLLVDDYAHYTVILRRSTARYGMARVFISGSAAEYAPWSEREAQQFVQELSRAIIQEGFGIVSGFGEGVGTYVVNGILEQLDREGTQLFDDRIVLRPFPLGISNAAQRERRWTAYRTDMMGRARVAIFLFGNKKDASGRIVAADGVEEEFKIALEKGITPIPVGCTGSMTTTLHKKVLDDFSCYFPTPGYKQLFEDLGRMATPRQAVTRVVKLLKKLRENAQH